MCQIYLKFRGYQVNVVVHEGVTFNFPSSQTIIKILTVTKMCQIYLKFKSSPNDRILDQSKLKVFADDTINVAEKLKFVVGKVEKLCGKRRKCWLPAFSPFPTMF